MMIEIAKKLYVKMSENGIVAAVSTLVMTIVGLLTQSELVAEVTPGQESQGNQVVGKHVTGEPLTTDITRKEAEDLIKDPIDREVVKMYQSGIPIDQITRMSPTVSERGMEYEYYSVDTRLVEDVVSQLFSPTDKVQGNLYVANPNMWDRTDIIRVCGVKGYNGSQVETSDIFLNLYVVEVMSDHLCVQAVNGPLQSNGVMYIPQIPADTKLLRIGHAASEGDVQTAPYSALPQKEKGFMQIFKAQVMSSTIQNMSEKEVNWTPSDIEELNLYNMRKEIEAAYLFGVKSYFRNETSKRYVYTCSGLFQQLLTRGRTLIVPEDLQESDLIDVEREIFTGNNGSPERILLAGSNFVSKISKLDSIQRQIDSTKTERRYGITWREIVSNFGSLYLYMHPMFDEFGLSDYAMAIDKAYLSKRVFRSLTRDALDLKKAGLYDGESTVLTEISSIVLKYPKCHMLLVPENPMD